MSVELIHRKTVMLSNMFRAESFLKKKKKVTSEIYALSLKSCKILNRISNEDLGETPRGSDEWLWQDVNCACAGLTWSGWEEFSS